MSVCPLCEDLGDGLCDAHWEAASATFRRERDDWKRKAELDQAQADLMTDRAMKLASVLGRVEAALGEARALLARE